MKQLRLLLPAILLLAPAITVQADDGYRLWLT